MLYKRNTFHTFRVTRPYRLMLAFGNSRLQRYRSMNTSETPRNGVEKNGMADKTWNLNKVNVLTHGSTSICVTSPKSLSHFWELLVISTLWRTITNTGVLKESVTDDRLGNNNEESFTYRQSQGSKDHHPQKVCCPPFKWPFLELNSISCSVQSFQRGCYNQSKISYLQIFMEKILLTSSKDVSRSW